MGEGRTSGCKPRVEESPAVTTSATTLVHPLLLTTRQAAQMLAIGERTLWELTRQKAIPCVRIGRAVRYSPLDLQAWIEAQKCSEPPNSTGPQT
jgi:excisionase family DNA binding protein